MTPHELLKETLEQNRKEYEQLPKWAKNQFFPKNLFPAKPEILEDILPKPIDSKIKETWIELNPVEWEYISRIYV